MKPFIIALFTCLITCVTQAQVTHQSLIAEGRYSEHANAIAFDAAGNLYFTGAFQGNIEFAGEAINAEGDSDIIIGKCAADGTPLWASRSGSSFNRPHSISEYGTALAINENFLYVAGVFRGTATFSEEAQRRSTGSHDIFLAQYTLEGRLNWVRSIGGASQDLAEDLALDALGNIYITGAIQHTASFDENTRIKAQSGREAFLAKYDQEGNLMWVRYSSSPGNTHSRGLAIHENQIIVAGDFTENTRLNQTNITSNGASDGFLWSVSLDGQENWTKAIGSDGEDGLTDIQINQDHLYVSGQFNNAREAGWTSIGKQDVFLQQYDLSGHLQWSKTMGGPGHDVAKKLAIDEHGHIIITGNFEQHISIGNEIEPSSGGSDIFVSEFDEFGQVKKFQTLGGSGQDKTKDVAFREGHLYLSGNYWGRWSNHQSAGRSDAFIASLAIEESEQSEFPVQYKVFPNPVTNGIVSITSDDTFKSIHIINTQGLTVYEATEEAMNQFDLNVSSFVSGIYFVKIDGKIVKKLIVEQGR